MGKGAPRRPGHLTVAGSRAALVRRLVERPDIVMGAPDFRGTLVELQDCDDDRMRLILTRRGFALWSPLGKPGEEGQEHEAAVLPAMVEVTVRNLGKRSALTFQRRMHPRTLANLVSSAAIFMMWTSLLLFTPQLWIALLLLPAFLVLPLMCVHQALRARTRDRRAWDALTETLAPLELAKHSSWTPFRISPSRP
jgi:hypothetical protein